MTRWSDKGDPFRILIRGPFPLCTEDNKRYVCLQCVEQRMEHPHFMVGCRLHPVKREAGERLGTEVLALGR